MAPSRNVLGGELETCGLEPLTGFFRDGCCNTAVEDQGSHTICAVVTTEFLEHQTSIGNPLTFGTAGSSKLISKCVSTAIRNRFEKITFYHVL